MTINSSMLLSI